MTPRQIELVENSWSSLFQNTNDIGIIFYDRLFEIDPKLRPLFRDDIESQAKKLIHLITFAVHKLNNLNEIIADVKALGARHRKYNVLPEHYSSVASALLWTLEKALGDQWTAETKEAWTKVYAILSTTMMNATEEAV